MNFIPILLTLVVLVNCEDDYCSICDYHIACNNTGEIAPKCSSTAKLIDLKATGIIDNLIKIHNTKRNIVALGKLENFEPATRMATMEWDDELAEMAALNVKTCELQHDICHDTKTFKYAGQNLAQWIGNKPDIKPLEVAENLVEDWFRESKDANMSIINEFPAETTSPVCHFAVMIADRNTRLGCAMIMNYKDIFNEFILACNYAITNFVEEPVYVAGETASDCETGTNSEFPGLCSINEKIDVFA